MRLYEDEKQALHKALHNVDDEVYLFGSRVDDNKRGGDIDILIYSKQDSLKLSQQVSRIFLTQLDSKIDVVVFDKNNMTQAQKAFASTLKMIKIK